ncbi:hypothetical protein [Kushneria phosphatilytica]|uniref:Uncharacterized protein n=1 Tax=Kushneria phosphatilytica TaxID=657387 RepID=A0A1S1NLL9_9GAMM|nr:hypothetical protein [Kushneria phosphatilytica]OHV07666.1 hypothetical protein BH688_15835 [Kushneria phosphatilytica]QEL10161.1 hypothetical protein FY550_02770 [Kushneria phosphatilytica]
MEIRTDRAVVTPEGESFGRVVSADERYVKIETASGKHRWIPRELMREEADRLVADQAINRRARIEEADPDIDMSDGSERVDEAVRETFPASDPPDFTSDRK